MEPLEVPTEEMAALEDERAFTDLSSFRKVRVSGVDARGWLGDLVTCDVASLEPGGSRRSLLLTPTGRIRADFWVALDEEGFLLIQPPDQPDLVGSLLAPYVLSSDVLLHDATDDLSMFAILGAPIEVPHGSFLTPSVLGGGRDLVLPAGALTDRTRGVLTHRGLIEVRSAAMEVWRIRRGVPRMGVDFAEGSLPAEVGLESTIDIAKGCFLGQESVARVRNLGRVSQVLRAVRAAGSVGVGDPVRSGGERVGEVTSAAPGRGGGTAALIRVRSTAEDDGPVTTRGGVLVPVPSMD
jgi:folate-binding protein YgfZ